MGEEEVIKECPWRAGMEDPACIKERCELSIEVDMVTPLGKVKKRICTFTMLALNSQAKPQPPQGFQIPPGMLRGLNG